MSDNIKKILLQPIKNIWYFWRQKRALKRLVEWIY